MKSRLVLILLFLVMTEVVCLAGDASQYAVIGFSKDGKYFAFERYGTYDGSAFPYSEIFFLDVCKNSYANNPLRFVLEEGGGDEDDAREQNLKKAQAILTKFGIDVTLKGKNVLAASTDKAVIPFEFGGHKMNLNLMMTATGNAACGDDQTEKKLTLSLTRKGTAKVLQKDTKVPKSRACAYAYSVQGIICYNLSMVVITDYDTPGFEGPNTRQIAISGCMW